MRILFLSHYFPPEVNAPATRTYEHCKEWVERGHEVTVVTCTPNHPRGIPYDGYKNKIYQKEQVDGINIVRVWSYMAANEGFAKRSLNYVSYMLSVFVASPFLPKSDIVISTSPQFFNGLAGYFVSRVKKAHWILEIRDLWPESILVLGAIKNKYIIAILEWLETLIYRKSDRIVIVVEGFRKHIVGKGVDSRKIVTIKNGVNFSLFKPVTADNSVAEKYQLKDKFVIAYLGTQGMAHGLKVLLFAAKELLHKKDILFVLVGDGGDNENLVNLKEQLNLTNVLFVGQQSKEMMPYFWSLIDVSFVHLKKLDLFKAAIPSKIFESMAMEKPIILGLVGEGEELIRDADAGICIEPENKQQLVAAILELYNNRAEAKRLGSNGRRYVKNNYNRKQLAKRFEELMLSLGTCMK